jgi:hypothetical protein
VKVKNIRAIAVVANGLRGGPLAGVQLHSEQFSLAALHRVSRHLLAFQRQVIVRFGIILYASR